MKKPSRKRKAAKEVSAKSELEWMLGEYSRLARHFSLTGPEPDVELFKLWSGKALEAARFLLPHQVPRLSSSMPVPPADDVIEAKQVAVKVDVDFSTMSTDELIAHYRSRIAAGPADPVVDPAHFDLPLPSPKREAAEQPVTVTCAPVETSAEESSEVEPVEPQPAPAEPPVVQPPPDNVVKLHSVEQYADSIASSIGADGRPVASEHCKRRLLEQARHGGMGHGDPHGKSLDWRSPGGPSFAG